MLARKCDRCGALYESYNVKNCKDKPNGCMVLNIDDEGRYFSHGFIDLCPACMGIFQDFMDMKKEG